MDDYFIAYQQLDSGKNVYRRVSRTISSHHSQHSLLVKYSRVRHFKTPHSLENFKSRQPFNRTFRLFYHYLLFSLLIPKVSLAHVPFFENRDFSEINPYVLTSPIEKSIAIYSHFSLPEDIDVIHFTRPKSDKKYFRLQISTLVPGCESLKHILPTIFILGPRQKNLPLEESPIKEIVMTQNQSGILLDNAQQGSLWFEPYSRKSYFQQHSLNLHLDNTGEYWIYVWEKNGQHGDYVLELGDREQWSLWDMIRTLGVMPKLWLDWEIHDESCRNEL